jgi:hypothetical protein
MKAELVISDEALKEALENSPSPDRVTEEYMNSRIEDCSFTRISDGTMTICVINLDNGFQVIGKSACADPDNYNKDIGQKIAYDNAFRELWPLFGFLLKEKLHLAKLYTTGEKK